MPTAACSTSCRPPEITKPMRQSLPYFTQPVVSKTLTTDSQQHRRRHKKLTDWARQALLQVARWLPDRRVVAVADSSYAVIDLLNAVRHRLCVIARLRLDARLFEPPPQRRPRVGRPRVVGRRLPNLSEQLASRSTRWHRLQITGWYGRTERQVEIVSGTAIWSHPGHHVPIRYVLVRDCKDEFRPQAFWHRSHGRSTRHPALVRSPLVHRGHLRRGPSPPRRRDPTPMVRSGRRPHHPRLARPVLPRRALGGISIAAQSCASPRQASWYSKPLPTFAMLWPQCAVPYGRA